MSDRPFRFGVLSTAKIGREHVIPAVGRAPNCTVSAIASRSERKARAFADRVGAPHAFGSYEALLESDEVDGVYVPLPTSMHLEWAIAAARAGKHVLVEKPLALKAKDIEPLIRARDEHGVVVSEAFMVVYHPQWAKVRALLAKGAVGTLRRIEASFSYFNVDAKNMRNRPELGGGALPDIGVYPTVAARFATGREPERVRASVEFDPGFGTDRHASVQVDFGDAGGGVEMSFYVSTQLAARQTIVFHGDKGFLELAAPFNSNLYEGDEIRLHDRGHAKVQTFRHVGVDQYALEVEAFADAARTGDTSGVFSLEDSVRNQRVIDAAYRSGRTGRWEKV